MSFGADPFVLSPEQRRQLELRQRIESAIATGRGRARRPQLPVAQPIAPAAGGGGLSGISQVGAPNVPGGRLGSEIGAEAQSMGTQALTNLVQGNDALSGMGISASDEEAQPGLLGSIIKLIIGAYAGGS